MLPLNADGGEITILRTLAAYSYGGWSVEWPESVPEEEQPNIDDDREFGYVYRLRSSPGRMGRRFVHKDVDITAADYGPDGVALPYSGESNVEQVLNEADRNTDGDAFFEREITREGLGPNRPYVDFKIGDIVPATMWGLRVDNVVTSIEAVTEEGAVVDWRVHIGSQLLSDRDALSEKNREIERAIAQERRERKDDTRRTTRSVSRAQSTANDAQEGVNSVREIIGGKGADDGTLIGQLKDLNEMLQMHGDDPADGLLPAYINTNTMLWELQQQWNDQQELINDQQKKLSETNRRMIDSLNRDKELESLSGEKRNIDIGRIRPFLQNDWGEKTLLVEFPQSGTVEYDISAENASGKDGGAHLDMKFWVNGRVIVDDASGRKDFVTISGRVDVQKGDKAYVALSVTALSNTDKNVVKYSFGYA